MTSRRHFLSVSTAAFAASSFHIFGAEPNKKFRTALIGSGWCGMNILREAEDALAQQTQDAHRAAPSIAT